MMKIREVIPKMTTIDEGKVINYYSMLADKEIDRDKGNEADWVERNWAELMNKKRHSNHIRKLWMIKVAQYRQAAKDGRLEKFIDDGSRRIQ